MGNVEWNEGPWQSSPIVIEIEGQGREEPKVNEEEQKQKQKQKQKKRQMEWKSTEQRIDPPKEKETIGHRMGCVHVWGGSVWYGHTLVWSYV